MKCMIYIYKQINNEYKFYVKMTNINYIGQVYFYFVNKINYCNKEKGSHY